jgi:CheY-like chemotaxis protein
MRKSAALFRTPILAVSASPQKKEALAAGANVFLPKPYKSAEIRHALQELLHED